MPTPNLIHPVPIEVQQIDRSSTYYDEDAREPIQHAARLPTVNVPGQVRWVGHHEQEHERGGVQEGERGYVTFRQVDLDAKLTAVLGRGDRLSKIGKLSTDVYLTRLEPLGHYPDQGGHSLLKAYFTDRQPAKGVV